MKLKVRTIVYGFWINFTLIKRRREKAYIYVKATNTHTKQIKINSQNICFYRPDHTNGTDEIDVTFARSLLKSFFLFPYRTLVCLDESRTQSCSNIVASWYFLIILSLLYCTIYDRWTWLYYDQTDCGRIDEWMKIIL